ncbi:hypothetical protein [Candidatus Nitrospira bockiana]
MKGWKTWVAAVGAIAWGVGGLLGGVHDADVAMGFVTTGLGLVGIGHKLEKLGQS